MKNRLLWMCFLFLLPITTMAQETGPFKIYQLSGMIFDSESGKGEEEAQGVPFVRIQVNHSRRGILSNEEGFYSIPVTELDTLYFSHLGYHPGKLVIKDYLEDYRGDKSQYIYSINYLTPDTLTLPNVYIFPYKTPEELKTAVVNMDILYDSPEAIARQNLDPEVMHTIIQTLPTDGEERLVIARQRYYNYYQNKNLLPTVGLNAMEAMRFLKYVADKAKKRRNKSLNYWE